MSLWVCAKYLNKWNEGDKYLNKWNEGEVRDKEKFPFSLSKKMEADKQIDVMFEFFLCDIAAFLEKKSLLLPMREAFTAWMAKGIAPWMARKSLMSFILFIVFLAINRNRQLNIDDVEAWRKKRLSRKRSSLNQIIHCGNHVDEMPITSQHQKVITEDKLVVEGRLLEDFQNDNQEEFSTTTSSRNIEMFYPTNLNSDIQTSPEKTTSSNVELLFDTSTSKLNGTVDESYQKDASCASTALDLSNMNLTSFPINPPLGETLLLLNLSNNKIQHLDDDLLSNYTPNLVSLFLHSNLLTSLPSCIGFLARRQLLHFTAHDNPFTKEFSSAVLGASSPTSTTTTTRRRTKSNELMRPFPAKKKRRRFSFYMKEPSSATNAIVNEIANAAEPQSSNIDFPFTTNIPILIRLKDFYELTKLKHYVPQSPPQSVSIPSLSKFTSTSHSVENTAKRSRVIEELAETERTFVVQLSILKQLYLPGLEKLSTKIRKIMFSNIVDILQFHKT